MNSKEIDFLNVDLLREMAEEELKSQQHNYQITEEVIDLKKLLHELQVHQIELEMQNEELRYAYETSETTLRKYTMLYDLSPSGYFTLNSEGSIKDLNFTGAEILGEKRFSLIESNFKLFVAESSKPVFNDFLKKAYNSNSKESCEILLRCNNKPQSSVYIEGVVTADDQNLFLSVIDLSKFFEKRE